MATTWAATAREIMTDALTMVGAIAVGEEIPGDLLPLTLRTFNGLAKEMSLHGYTLPNISLSEVAMTWSSGTPAYVSAPADLWTDMQVSMTDASGNRKQLSPMTNAQWLATVDKDASAQYPTHFFEEANGRVYLWPVPTQDPGLVCTYVQKPDDISLDAVTDFPAAGALALTWGLAAHLAPHFEKDPAPLAAVWVSKREDLISAGVNSAPVVVTLDD